jgi:hypothetical protein
MVPVKRTEPGSPVIFATRSDGTTIDQDAQGGNPFATALIEATAHDHRTLGAFAKYLRAQTQSGSGGHQTPEWQGLPMRHRWTVSGFSSTRAESRMALVLIVSIYPAVHSSLAGAQRDERRIAACLAGHGYSVEQGVAGDRASLAGALRGFAVRSREYDSAIVYSTGHGVESAGETYLLPSSYPFDRGYAAALLRRHAIPVSQLRRSCSARAFNLTFFAGCRSRV